MSIQFKQVHGNFLLRVVWSFGRLQRFWWEFSFSHVAQAPTTSSIFCANSGLWSELAPDFLDEVVSGEIHYHSQV